MDYNEIFRDGQDTARRDFCFNKSTEIDFGTGNNKVNISLVLVISNEESSKIVIHISTTNNSCQKYKNVVGLVKKIFKTEEDPNNGKYEFELGNL